MTGEELAKATAAVALVEDRLRRSEGQVKATSEELVATKAAVCECVCVRESV